MPSMSVVVVTYGSAAALERLLPALEGELAPGDEVIVVDNASIDRSVHVAQRAGARVVRNHANAGFAAACAQGVELARGDLVLLLNPDCVPEPGFRAAITAPYDGPWTAWQGLVLDGDVVNTSGGVVHFTGLAWAGQAGEPVPADLRAGPAGFVSGACLAIRREAWERAGGFAPGFFMYHEDVELSLRLRLAGAELGVAPDARVDHDYTFAKGPAKWRLLERNRWATILRTYPAPLLARVLPALLALELALWPASVAGGWWRPKTLATLDVVRALPRLLAERRAVQATQAIAPRAFADALTWEPASAYFGPVGRAPLVRALLRAYWAAVLRSLPPR